jgi:TolB-like protein/Flp pilus assembly protein TadD
MSAILTKEPPDLSATNRSISPGLDRVVRHCLEKDPERRFHSAHDLAFDLESLSDAPAPTPAPAPLSRSWRRIALPVAAALILGVAAFLWMRRSSAGGASLDSVAVLPFVNATRDPQTEYLSDGIAETIINSLSGLPNLRVAPRSSVFRYKGREEDPQKIGRELDVRAVVSGKVLQRGDRVTVQADLVDIAKGSQIWGDQYDRPMSEILQIQQEIARDLSEKLQVRMTGEQREKLGKGGTQNTEAFQLYLKGRYAWEKRRAENLRESTGYFQKAIELDPSFALAYTGLAGTYAVLPSYSIMSPAEAFPRAKAAARKALEIDDNLAPAHAALAQALSELDRDWAGAEAEYRKAIAIDPSYATGHFWYALLLSKLQRYDEALREIKTAAELDPFSQIIQANSVRIRVWAGRFSEAIEEGRKVSSEFPNFGPPHFFLALAYAETGAPREAAAEFRKSAALTVPPQEAWLRGQGAALEGRVDEARACIADLEALSARQYVSPSYIATIYIRLGEKDRAFRWLERAFEDRSYDLGLLTVDPMFAGIRGDPRYDDLVRRMGLPRATR